LRGKRQPKNLGYLGNLKKLPKENDRPICKNSPNLVTLVATTLSDLEHLNCNAANVSALTSGQFLKERLSGNYESRHQLS
jgi:hypothetical protein